MMPGGGGGCSIVGVQRGKPPLIGRFFGRLPREGTPPVEPGFEARYGAVAPDRLAEGLDERPVAGIACRQGGFGVRKWVGIFGSRRRFGNRGAHISTAASGR